MWVEFMSNFGEVAVMTLCCQNQRVHKAQLNYGQSPILFPCVIGKNGQTAFKREGDGKTPRGIFHPLYVYYRADKIPRPRTVLNITPIQQNMGWCDAREDRNYNRPVSLPYAASTESLWRDDDMYDLIIVLDHNQCPRIKGAGSAIFMHIAKKDYSGTEGCIALSKPHLTQLLEQLTPATKLMV